ncbi:MAG: AI-2E family transporter [Bacteroidetes bacterium]|nr:MAG: AI-2E family transporter [Bacteroidota bacterium]
MPLYTLKERNNIILIILIAVGIFLLYASSGIIGAFLGAIIFYTFFRSLHIDLVEKKGWSPGLSAFLIILLSFFAVIVPFLFTVSMVVSKIQQLSINSENIKQLIANIDQFAAENLKQPHLAEDIFAKAQTIAIRVLSSVAGRVGKVFMEVLIMYFLLYFMLTGHKQFEASLRKYSPLSEANNTRFGKEIEKMTFANILGQGLISLVQGSSLALSFFIFKVPDPVFWGMITVFISFIPFVGAPLIFIPAAAIQLSNGNTFAGIGLLLWGFLIIFTTDNVLRFFISKWFAKTHPLIIIMGVVIGIPTFGIVGLVFGPLLISGFLILANIYIENRRILEKEAAE